MRRDYENSKLLSVRLFYERNLERGSMTTRLTKPVGRKCISAGERGRLFVVTLEPGDLVGVRIERTRRTEYMPIEAIYHAAVKARVLAERQAKAAKRKARRG
jgi:hypothetical protein